MKIIKIFLVLTLVIVPSLITANIRAPYHKTFESGGEIHSSVQLTVLSANLMFNFENYYSGELKKVQKSPEYICKVLAIYKIKSEKRNAASFDFITPSVNDFLVKINNEKKSTIVKAKKLQKTGVRFGKMKKNHYLYTVKFNSVIKKGISSIEVTYLQPISIYENDYGYFTSSKWSSYVEYQYWPIKEWKRDNNFTSEILVSVPYDWGFFDYINGADIEILVKGKNKEKLGYETFIFKSMKQRKEGNKLVKKFVVRNQLPDILQVSIEE